MNIFKFWVKTALVLASALCVIGIISVIVFQVLYGWHTDILSPVEHLVKVLLLGGFKIALICVWLAIGNLLMMVYTGEVLTKDPSKPVEEAPLPKAPVTYWPLVQRIRNYLTSRGYHLLNTEYANIAMFALSMLDAKNIPIPEKDEDLWKLIEPKVKQYIKPSTPDECVKPTEYSIHDTIARLVGDHGYVIDTLDLGFIGQLQSLYFRKDLAKGDYPSDALVWSCIEDEVKKAAVRYGENSRKALVNDVPWVEGVEDVMHKSVKDRLTELAQTPIQDADAAKPNTDCPNGYPKFSVRYRLTCILKDYGHTGEYDLDSLYSLCHAKFNGAELSNYSDSDIWSIIQPIVEAIDAGTYY